MRNIREKGRKRDRDELKQMAQAIYLAADRKHQLAPFWVRVEMAAGHEVLALYIARLKDRGGVQQSWRSLDLPRASMRLIHQNIRLIH